MLDLAAAVLEFQTSWTCMFEAGTETGTESGPEAAGEAGHEAGTQSALEAALEEEELAGNAWQFQTSPAESSSRSQLVPPGQQSSAMNPTCLALCLVCRLKQKKEENNMKM